jgi:KaiC/GvpD/RAD55 family RecA-like ATPase
MQQITKNIKLTDYISDEIDFTNSERLKTGYFDFDLSTKGFRKGGTYLVAGAEKSGKSSFLMKCMLGFLEQGKKVAVFDTELDGLQFYSRLLAIENDITVFEAEKDKDGIKNIQKKYFDKLIRFDSQRLSKDGLFIFDLTIDLAKKSVSELGCNILVFDNLTTYQSQNAESKNMVLPACISKVITVTKSLGVWSFIVTHLKPEVKISDLPRRVSDFIKESEPEKIFTETIALIRRPTTADIYGGQQALSQLSGTMIVWRPYQFYRNSENVKRFTQLLVLGFRDGASNDVYFNFCEEKVRFTEMSLNQMSTKKLNVPYKDDSTEEVIKNNNLF